VLLVRHAHAGSRRQWPGPDAERPLSPQGWAQARALVAVLAPWAVDEVRSSPFLRCTQTLEPLAERLGLTVAGDEELAEGSPPERSARLVRELLGRGTSVLCTHGDVIPDVLARVVGASTPAGAGLPLAKGSIWVLEAGPDRAVAARYLPPPGAPAG